MGLAERLVVWALSHRAFVVLCVAALAFTGVLALLNLGVEAFPDLTNNQVVIVTEADGLAVPEVEQRVTYPLETSLMGLPGAAEVRSISKFGLSLVTVVFDDDVPLYFARQVVTERIADARSRLPDGLEPVLGPVATAFGEIYQYLVESDSPMETKTYHDWDIRNRLRAVRGVGEVNSWGGLTQQYQVMADPRRLEKHGLMLSDVVNALDAGNRSFSGGFLEARSERLVVRGQGLVAGLEDVRRTVIASRAGTPIRIGDVAEVSLGAHPRQGAVTHDGKGETLAGMVIMLKGENGRDVADRVKSRIEEIRKTLPAGTRITPFYDQSEVIARTSGTVRTNLLEGSLLVVAVLFIFLWDIRAALLVAVVIPLSLLCAFIGMRVTGVSANLMSLGAIDFGLIVDGAVVMIESVVRKRQHVGAVTSEAERRRIFVDAATEVARPVLYGVLIILAVYLPLFTLEGVEGKMFRPMAITVCSALLGALALSLTAVPVGASLVLRSGAHHADGRWFEWVRRHYLAALEGARRWRIATISAAVVIVVAAIGSISWLGTEFMPKLDEGAILVETRKLPSVSLEDSVEISTRIERVLKTFPEVRQVVTKLGRPDLATEAMGIYQGDVYVNLTPMATWTTGRDKEGLVEAMARELSVVPGVTFNFTQPMAMRLDEVVSGVKADVAVKIFGPDMTVLQRLGNEVERRLGTVRGVADLQTELVSGGAQLEVGIDRDRAARYGLRVADIQQVVEAATGGAEATMVLDGARRFSLVVRLPDEFRQNPEAFRTVPLVAPGGERLTLGQVASLDAGQTPELIAHENGERRLVVQANARGRDVGGVVADSQARLADLSLPSGYYLEWGGQFENQQRATRRLMVIVPLSLAIIFILLFATFGNARQATLVVLNVPFALVGGIAALWVRGLTLTLSASVGFIALFGVAVLNGVVLISAVNQRRESGLDLVSAIRDAASTRLKPVLMTALVAALGFMPMALSHGAGAEVQRPLATVVIGGILTSTLLTLIVLPLVYEMIERRADRDAPARR